MSGFKHLMGHLKSCETCFKCDLSLIHNFDDIINCKIFSDSVVYFSSAEKLYIHSVNVALKLCHPYHSKLKMLLNTTKLTTKKNRK